MGTPSGAQKHLGTASDGFLQIFCDKHLLSLKVKQDLAVGILLVSYIHFLCVGLAHIVDMLGVIKESQENTEILRHHVAHGRFWLLCTGITEEKQTLKQCTSNYCKWSL